MGTNSSQIEHPQASQPLKSQEDDRNDDADEDAVSAAGSNKTSASRALARDLERSVMESSQDYITEPPPKKRRKKSRAKSQSNGVDEALKTEVDETAVSPTRSAATEADHNEDEENNSNGHDSNDDPSRVAARKHLVRELRRMKKTVLVSSGKARWAPGINGAKWDVEKLRPSQWANRQLTQAEEQTLARYKEKVKEAKQRLREFDEGLEQKSVGEEAEENVMMVEVAPAAKDEDRPDAAVNGEVEEHAVGMAEPEEITSPAPKKLSAKERKKEKKKARRKSRPNPDADIEMEEDIAQQQPQPEPQDDLGQPDQVPKKNKKKRTRTKEETSSVPPPTMVNESIPVLRSVAGKHKTELVRSWLGGQEESEAISEVPEEDLEMPVPSRKRKRVSKHQDDDDADFKADSQDECDSPAADDVEDGKSQPKSVAAHRVKARASKSSNRSSQSKKKATSHDEDIASTQRPPATISGAFSAEEKSLADSIFNRVLHDEGIDEATLKHQIIDWRRTGIFKDEIEAAFPARDKTSLRKFCQRRYHMQERGAWTAEQDEDLRTAQANFPGQWRKHQDLVGRTAADCKDRWTQQLQYSKRTGAWSRKEEADLVTAVHNAIETIKADGDTDAELLADDVALENALSWKVIASDLGNKRNYKQCREKWGKLKRREQRQSVMPEGEVSREPLDEAEKGFRKSKSAKRAVRRFEIGDFYDVFVETHTSFDDTSQHYHDEQNVVWSIVAMKNPASRFSLHFAGGTIRRVALEHALQEWKIDSKKVRRKLEKAETLPAKAKVLAQLLEKSYAGRLHSMSRTFLPEMVGKSRDEILQVKEQRKRKWAEGKSARLAKARIRSQEFVDDTEEEEEQQSDPPTPAIADSEDEKSDDTRSDEEQSVCQRRLDAQINGRHENAESELDLPRNRRRPFPDVKNGLESSSPDPLAQGAVGKSDRDFIKEEPVDDSSEFSRDYTPESPDSEKDAEMRRLFDEAIAEAEAKVAPSTPVGYDSEDDDGDEGT